MNNSWGIILSDTSESAIAPRLKTNSMDLNLTPELSLNKQAKSFLLETAKWSKFLAIMGFIMVGFMVIGGLFFGSIMGAVANLSGDASSLAELGPFGFLGLIYVAMALLYFFPIWYLFKFATQMQMALKTDGEAQLTAAFSNLKSHYKFVGIFTIVILSIYVLMFLFSGIFFAAMN